jgi:cysteinyl-tRNA synthetase
MPLRIHDNLRRTISDFTPVRPGHAGMYVCGLTVQDRPHVGHMRAMVAGDVMRRYLEHTGLEVTYVLNFTDIDDRIIQKANTEGVHYTAIAERYIDAYFRAADALHIRRATVHPRATEHIPEIVDLIRRLEEKDYAYASGGDVFYAVEKFSRYGQLSGKRLEDLRAGSRVEVDEAKRNPLDFVLWKGAKPGEPAWESPWGVGRPGWHIECSAMAMRYLGETLDLHGGGEDLLFPHHENEIAQSEAATERPFCNFWVEVGFVNLVGEKMSKSTQHFVPVEDVLKEHDPEALRLYVLSTFYRSPIEFAWDRVNDSATALARLYGVLRAGREAAESRAGQAEGPSTLAAEIDAAADGFHAAMSDDFNTPRALGHLFNLARTANRAADAGDRSTLAAAGRTLHSLGTLLGLFWNEPQEETFGAEVMVLVERREQARRERDWATADALRRQLADCGVVVEDRPGGPALKRSR